MSGPDFETARRKQLHDRIAALGIQESDLEESFTKSGGRGGQNVNKVATCVVLLHRPTGLQVKCQSTRHQGRNRLLARELLLRKFEEMQSARAAADRARVEKARRQNRKKSRGAKERMLQEKAHRAEKKQARRPDKTSEL